MNGEDCAMVYREKPGGFDVILMDMQVRNPDLSWEVMKLTMVVMS